MKSIIIFLIVFCPSLLYSQSLLDKIITIQDTALIYNNTPYESIISFAKSERNQIFKKFHVDFNNVDCLHILEGYNPVTGNLYGMFWINKKGYCYYVKVDSNGEIVVKTQRERNYLNNKSFRLNILKDVNNWEIKDSVLSGVHDGLYLIAIKVNRDGEIKIKKFYEY